MRPDLLREYVELIVEKIRSKPRGNGRFGTKFDIKQFKELDGINLMLQYAKEFLEIMGTGSSRMAFLFSSRYVLKIAINKKGLAQNEAEVDVFTNPKSKGVVAKVYSSDPQFRWLVSDLVKPLSSPAEFEDLTGIDWPNFVNLLRPKVKSNQPVSADDPKIVQATAVTAQQNNLLFGDLEELSHWGKTPDGRAVLLDYGFTGEVWRSHYSQKPKMTGNTAGSEDKTANAATASDTAPDNDKTGAAVPAAKRPTA